ARAAELEAAVKRRENVRVELYLAGNARDSARLQVAVREARGVGLDGADLEAAEAELAEVLEEDRSQKTALVGLEEAISQREPEALCEALCAAEKVFPRLPADRPELLSAARALLAELEEAARLAEDATARRWAADTLKAAVAEDSWDAIQDALQHGLKAGLAEEGAPILAARATLDRLRGAKELQEAEGHVRQKQARLQDLAAREALLSGPSHKKERSAIGKEIMSLRNSEAFISARSFLKDPEKEKRRRDEHRLEIEKRAAEERERWRRRLEEAPVELAAALEAADEDAVRALLIEAVLQKADAQAAEEFLGEREARRKAAERDATLLEFCFAGLERRAFFQASVAMNELFTDQYGMQEGTDFKLKVVKASNSVLVSFRSVDFAEAVRRTAIELAKKLGPSHSASVVVSAELRGPLEFSSEVDEFLPAARQDTEALQRKPSRPESEAAVLRAEQRAPGEAELPAPVAASAWAAGRPP
ncbi:unnamed protein product, partial [Polarella glacialis]